MRGARELAVEDLGKGGISRVSYVHRRKGGEVRGEILGVRSGGCVFVMRSCEREWFELRISKRYDGIVGRL